MKRKERFKSILSSLMYAGIYFAMQIVISLKIYSFIIIKAVFENGDMMSGDYTSIYNSLFSQVLTYTIPVLIVSAVISSIISFGLFSFKNPHMIDSLKMRSFNWKFSVIAVLLVVPVIGLSNFIVDIVLYFFPESIEAYESTITTLMEGTPVILLIIGIGIIAPIVEELIFRGFIFKRLKDSFPVWAAILIQALFFAVVHGNLVQMSYAFAVGLILGIIVYKSNSLYPAIILHIINNSVSTVSDMYFNNILYYILPLIAVAAVIFIAVNKKQFLFTKQ
ncbi:MAG: CPBP family intramembrane metalloprotease [Clostridia bacterium]|nr:CPBP family intramembrane metalloprotease [Clostridia bacterium]